MAAASTFEGRAPGRPEHPRALPGDEQRQGQGRHGVHPPPRGKRPIDQATRQQHAGELDARQAAGRVAGQGERRTLRTAGRYADVWHTWGTPASFAAKSRVLDDRCAEAGRDPAAVKRASGFFVHDLSDGAAVVAPWRGVCAEFVFGDVGHPADALIDAVVAAIG